MGRSVSYPSRSVWVNYLDASDIDADGWKDFVDDLMGILKDRFPSLYRNTTYLGREDVAYLQNNHCHIGVSEYCGLVSLWAVARDSDHPELAKAWIDQIEVPVDKLLRENYQGMVLSKSGTMSNGCSVFHRV